MVVDMERTMAAPGAVENLEIVASVLENNPETGPAMKAIHSLEDLYHFVTRFAKVKMEVVKEVFMDAVNYFKEDKVALEDAVLDTVVGGGFWSTIWNSSITRYAVATAVIVGCGLAGLVAGSVVGAIGGPTASGAGAIIGAIGGVLGGLVIAEKYILH